jgi:hypothetical protein
VKSGLQGGRLASESVAGIDRNQWPLSFGIGGRLAPEYAHDRRNQNWKPFRLLSQYCRKRGLDDYEAQELIEDRIGRRLMCECDLVGGPA